MQYVSIYHQLECTSQLFKPEKKTLQNEETTYSAGLKSKPLPQRSQPVEQHSYQLIYTTDHNSSRLPQTFPT